MIQVGAKVVSHVDAQGLVRGRAYDVVDRQERATPFGVFVALVVQDPETKARMVVLNGHLVLNLVA